jgi:hypothetical protein
MSCTDGRPVTSVTESVRPFKLVLTLYIRLSYDLSGGLGWHHAGSMPGRRPGRTLSWIIDMVMISLPQCKTIFFQACTVI